MKDQLLDLYRQNSELLNSRSAGIFNLRRENAYQRLSDMAVPSTRIEAYKYCPLFDRMDKEWGVNLNRSLFGISPTELFHCAIPGIKAVNFCMLNDVWSSQDEIDLGEGAFASSMKSAFSLHREIVERYYGSALRDDNDFFVAANELLAQDGYMIYVPAGVRVDMPLQAVNMLWSGRDMLVANRNLIVLEQGAELHLIDCDHSMDNASYFAMRMYEIVVGRDSLFTYYSLENTQPNVSNLRRFAISQDAGSRTSIGTFGITNGATRNHIEVDLNGPHAETWIGGSLLTRGQENCENYSIIRHHSTDCTSNELFKYILDDKSTAGFSGRIIVDHGAQHTVSYQTNRNVLLSDQARVLGRPQLEIYADDVKCGHGATTGMLDEMALFYMQQRGIGLAEARMLLLQAFMADVLDHVENAALQDRLRMLIEKRLRNEETGCISCVNRNV